MSRSRLLALLLVLGTLLLYEPVCRYPFIDFDDNDYVTDNPAVKAGLTWHGVEWAFTTWHAANWHPLTWLSHMLDCQLFGLNAGLHHTVNVLFHTVNGLLLFRLLWVLLRTGSEQGNAKEGKRDSASSTGPASEMLWPAVFVAALFAWHPMHVESVAWIAERKDVLSTFFALLMLLAYARYVREIRSRGRQARVFYALALLLFACGLMSKPMVVTLPCVMLLLDWWPLKRLTPGEASIRSWTRLLTEKIPFFLLTAVSCLITFLAQKHGGAVATLSTVSLAYRLENTPLAYASYLEKLFWPTRLAVFYPLPETISPWAVARATALLLAISAGAWLARRRAPYFAVGWLWFLGTLVPVIGLVQVGSAAFADRYSYFPSIGLFLAVTLGMREAVARFRLPKMAVGAAAGLVLTACLWQAHRQVNDWRSNIALFSHALAVTRNNETAHLNLAYALQKLGRNDEAMAEYRAALKINPIRPETHNNLANLLDEAGHRDEAEAEYRTALRINPRFVPALDNLGTLLVEEGRFGEALKLYAQAARLAPDNWHPPFLIGKALLKQGRDTEALTYFREAVRLDPNNSHVLAFLAEVLASDENSRVRNGSMALLMADKANALTGGYQPAVLSVLAMAYAEAGRFQDAQNAAQDALHLAQDLGDTNDVPQIQRQLELYRNHRPFRQSFAQPGGEALEH